jgi:hypothetical protein
VRFDVYVVVDFQWPSHTEVTRRQDCSYFAVNFIAQIHQAFVPVVVALRKNYAHDLPPRFCLNTLAAEQDCYGLPAHEHAWVDP